MPAPTLTTYSRMLLGVFSDMQIMSVPTGFQSMFGNPLSMSETLFIMNSEVPEREIIRGSKTIAPLIPRGTIGDLIDEKVETEQESTVFARSFPLGQKETSITVQKLNKRLAEESPYGPAFTKAERLRLISIKKTMELIRQLMGLMELLASLSVMTGKMPAILDTTNPDQIYDFRRNPDNIFTVSPLWDGVSPTIIADLDEACDFVTINGKMIPDMAILGRDTWKPFLDDVAVQKRLDNRRFEVGTINSRLNLPERFNRFIGPGGLEPRGFLETDKGRGLYLFSYDQHYERPKDTPLYFMPPKDILVQSSLTRGDRLFGPPEVLDPTRADTMWMEDRFGFTEMDLPVPANTPSGDIFLPQMFHYNAYESTNRKSIKMEAQVAPIYEDTQGDARAVITGAVS